MRGDALGELFEKSSPNPSKTSIQLKVKIHKGNFVFLDGLVRSVLKVFAELFPKKRLAEGTDKSKFEIIYQTVR